MSNKLNVKQEKFIQGLINGLSQRQAYKEAYNPKYSDKIVDNRACELFNKDEIQVRYKELLEKMQEKSIMTAIERRKWLTDIINGKIKHDGKTANFNEKLKALEMLNKMTGEYTQNINANIAQEIRVELDD